MLLLKKLLGEVPMVYNGGGKSPSAPPPEKLVAPTPPVEEAGVEVDDESGDTKTNTSKSSLKIPLAGSDTSGLKS